MSLLAGFDFMLEIDRGAALKLIKNSGAVLGRPLLPPFEVSLPLGANTSDNVHLIVQDVTLDLNPGSPRISLGFEFRNSTAFVQGLTVPRLSGQIFIRADLKIVPLARARSFQQVSQGVRDVTVGINLRACEVGLFLSETSKDRIRRLIANIGLTEEDFERQAKDRLQQFFRSLGDVAVGNSLRFRLDPNRDGDILEKPIRLTTIVDIRCVDHETIVVFGTMFKPNLGKGDIADKAPALRRPGQDLVVSISSEVFNRQVFCPSFAANIASKKKVDP